jgi:hypothetical protein
LGFSGKRVLKMMLRSVDVATLCLSQPRLGEERARLSFVEGFGEKGVWGY